MIDKCKYYNPSSNIVRHCKFCNESHLINTSLLLDKNKIQEYINNLHKDKNTAESIINMKKTKSDTYYDIKRKVRDFLLDKNENYNTKIFLLEYANRFSKSPINLSPPLF